MALVKLNCESCGGELSKISKDTYECEYCSSQYILKNDENLGIILELLTEIPQMSPKVSVLEAKKRIFEEHAKNFRKLIDKNKKNIEIWDEKLVENSRKITERVNVMSFILAFPFAFLVSLCFNESTMIFGFIFLILLTLGCIFSYMDFKKQTEEERIEYNNNRTECINVSSKCENELKDCIKNINYLQNEIMEL